MEKAMTTKMMTDNLLISTASDVFPINNIKLCAVLSCVDILGDMARSVEL